MRVGRSSDREDLEGIWAEAVSSKSSKTPKRENGTDRQQSQKRKIQSAVLEHWTL